MYLLIAKGSSGWGSDMRRLTRRLMLGVALGAILAEPVEGFIIKGGATSSPSPPPTSLTTLTWNNITTSSSWTAPIVSYFQPFKDGDVPIGGSVTATDSLGAAVVVQMDQITSWPSGHMAGAVLTMPLSETYGAGVSKTYQ